VLDLPEVVTEAKDQALNSPVRFVATDMFHSPLPADTELFSLVRVLHDHDDQPVSQLLARLHSALRPGGHLLIAEPMAGTAGAEPDWGHLFWLLFVGDGQRKAPYCRRIKGNVFGCRFYGCA
jgi:demethylspheroidene O-methyltransferase